MSHNATKTAEQVENDLIDLLQKLKDSKIKACSQINSTDVLLYFCFKMEKYIFIRQ